MLSLIINNKKKSINHLHQLMLKAFLCARNILYIYFNQCLKPATNFEAYGSLDYSD